MRLCALFAALVLAAPAPAADISASTMGNIADLLGTVSPDQPPAGADPDTWRKAVEALKKEGLVGVARPTRPGDTGFS